MWKNSEKYSQSIEILNVEVAIYFSYGLTCAPALKIAEFQLVFTYKTKG
jgi:hypothetical protein